MATPAYMSLWDDKNNRIAGTCQVVGREGTIEIYGFHHEVRIPTDEDTGTLTATRKHGNFVVLKDFCPATPLLLKACASGSTFKELRLSWYRIEEGGSEVEYFRHALFDVKVVSVKAKVQDVKDKATEYLGHREETAFRYKKIRWAYLDGNIETEDEWIIRA
jgi:type VI secretion system secreted protein Hcp